MLFLKLCEVGLGKRQRNNTTGFVYGVLRVDSLETGRGSRGNLPKLQKYWFRAVTVTIPYKRF